MSFLDRMEKKFGRFAIKGLMKYVLLVYAAGFIINLINPYFYSEYLMLDIDKLLSGQVWRLITFIIQPMESNIFIMALMLYVYFSIGMSLENIWGSFRFNVYYFSGILFNIVAVVIIYMIYGISYPISLSYLNMSLFLAFSTMFAETRFLFMFFIPIKAKYLAIFYVGLLAYDIVRAFQTLPELGVCALIAVMASMANYLIMFLATRNFKRVSPKEIHRRNRFKREYNSGQTRGGDNIVNFDRSRTITRHKCAICGRTELDDPNLEFRFCSKCAGNYEYCSEHLYTHTHVTGPGNVPTDDQ